MASTGQVRVFAVYIDEPLSGQHVRETFRDIYDQALCAYNLAKIFPIPSE